MPGNQPDLVPWLQALDVFVLPSFANQGVPQAILRAMRCGIPVTSTAIGSIVEAVGDKVTGPIASEKQSDALRESLESLLGDAEPRLPFGDAARKVAQEEFGIEVMLVKMEAVFSEAAGG